MRSSYNPAKSCYGKVAYVSRREAKQAKDRHSSQNGKLDVYYCDVCDHYHIGHNSKSIKGKRKKIIRHSAFVKRGHRRNKMHPEIKQIIKNDPKISSIEEANDKANYMWEHYPICLRYFGLGLGDMVVYFGAEEKQ